MAKRKPLDPKDQAWVEARKKHHLSHAHIQMARELGLNPKKLGGLDNHRQQPWKAPLPQFIEHLYQKSFGRPRPVSVLSIEDRAQIAEKKKAEKRALRAAAKLSSCLPDSPKTAPSMAPGEVSEG